MDTIYGALITIVPIVAITTLNVLIGKRLRHARKVSLGLQRVCSDENRLRLEFTGILLIVSTTFSFPPPAALQTGFTAKSSRFCPVLC